MNKLRGGIWGTPLGSALFGSAQTLITSLIKEHHADPNEYINQFHGTPLYFCISRDRSDKAYFIDLFLEYGADINGIGPAGLGGHYGTPLNVATVMGQVEIMQKLLEKGADPTLRANKQGWTSLQLACLANKPEAFKVLLDHAPDVNAHGRYGTPLQGAAYSGAKPMVRELLLRGVDIKVYGQGRYGHSLQSAAIRAREDVVRFLIKRGADCRVRGGRFGTILQAASVRCSKALVDFLIRKGANVDGRGGRYKTALQAACAAGNKAVVLTLLEHKANVNINGGRYGSALQAACAFGDLTVVKMLVQHGADVNFQGGFYGSAVDAAALNNRVSILRYLLNEAGVPPTAASRRHNHANVKMLNEADKKIQSAREQQCPPQRTTAPARNHRANGKQDAQLDDDVPMNIDSIPQWEQITALPTGLKADTRDLSLNSTTSSFMLPLGKKARKRLARKKRVKNELIIKEKLEEDCPIEELIDGDMTLGWLQLD